MVILTFLLGMQSNPDLHSLINSVRATQKSGDYQKALEEYNEIVLPNLDSAPTNLEYNARLLEILILKRLGHTDQALDSVNKVIYSIPDSLVNHKLQALSHRANLYWDNLKFDDYYHSLVELYELAEQEMDSVRMSRAVGNMYYFFNATNKIDSLKPYLKRLKGFLNDDETHFHKLRYEFYSGIYAREFEHNIDEAILHFGRAKRLINPEESFLWWIQINHEQIITWLEVGNYTRAEEDLKKNLLLPGVAESPNALYVNYSLLVRLYAYKGEIAIAKQYRALMDRIPRELHAYQSIEAKVHADIALSGGNSWESDPVFKHAKKSGMTKLQMLFLVLFGTGILLMALIGFKTAFFRKESNLSDSLRWSLVE